VNCQLPIYFPTLCAFFFALPAGAAPYDPPAVYLSWRSDPTTTMVIRWHSLQSENRETLVLYRRTDEPDWHRATGSNHPMPHADRTIHVVELTGLTPGSIYHFRPGENAVEFRFRTLPKTADEPLQFIVGGDTYGRTQWYNRLDPRDMFNLFRDEYYNIMRKVNLQAARQNPVFVVIGGDITYSEGHPDRADRWYKWLTAWKEDMVTTDGVLIPIVPVIGNHEILKNTYRVDWPSGTPYNAASQAPYYYSLFIAPDPLGPRVLDFGNYMCFLLLDSGHTNFVSAQKNWLTNTLTQRRNLPHKFAAYHVPAYPSYRSFDGSVSSAIREYWVPEFETYGLHAAFEHHDHTYKRTYPIRNNQPDPQGVLYLGDGAWGRLRSPKDPEDRWYLAFTAKEYHFIVGTLHKKSRSFKAINEEGKVFDQYSEEQHLKQAP
ncbi:MAG: metallophosphoesterase family protein, partial [bacterium]|nr:metallophosphoesterase family protein [bacterium]